MPDKFYLNALVDDGRKLRGPEKPGAWSSEPDPEQERKFLSDYAADIKVGTAPGERDVLERVPSVFAWPIQYARVLRSQDRDGEANGPSTTTAAAAPGRDDAHPLLRAIIPEWRGLLSTIALQDWLGVSLEARPFEIPAVAIPGEPRFVTVLRNQLPRPEQDWQRWWLLYADRELIGATSPWTIVYTPAEYRCPGSIPFQSEGRLADPIPYFEARSSAYELSLIEKWVVNVLQRYNWGMSAPRGYASGVKTALDSWGQELTAAIGRLRARGIETNVDSQIWNLGAMEAFLDHDPYEKFVAPLRREGGPDPEVTDLALDTRSEKPGRFVAISARGVPANVRVYQGVFGDAVDVEQLKAEGLELKTRSGHTVSCRYVVPERLFFPEKLAAFVAPEDEITTVDALAWPVTPRFFEFFSYARLREIGQRLRRRLEGQTLVVELELPLKRGRPLRVQRRYDFKTDLVRIGANVAFALWPDFYAEDWKDNFAACAGTDLPFEIQPVPETGVQPDQDPESRAWERSQPTDTVLRVWQLPAPAIGFTVLERRDAWSTEPPRVLGMIVRPALNRPVEIDEAREWTVAVDFGTSSSHLLVREGAPAAGQDRADVLTLKARLDFLGQPDPTGTLRLAIADNLYAKDDVKPPFATLLAESQAMRRPATADVRRIPWFSVYSAGIARLLGRVPVRDVKWYVAGQDAPLRDYLRGVVRLVLAEARAKGVKRVHFEWSYPLSLPEESRKSMAGFWRAVGSNFSPRQPAEVKASEDGVSEAEAACRFLNAQHGDAGMPVQAPSALCVVVDIGGGSSDVGFWSNGELLDEISIKLAGNDVVVPACRLDGFINALAALCVGRSLDPKVVEQMFKVSAEASVNGLLTEAEAAAPHDPGLHPVASNLFFSGASDGPPWTHVRTLIYIFFSGLGFLIGLVARALITNERAEVVLYVGGRGASLLTWLASSASDREALLRSAVRAGLALEPQPAPVADVKIKGPAIKPSPRLVPKEEVVRGLLSPALKGGSAGDAPSSRHRAPAGATMLGELLEGYTWDARLTEAELCELKLPRTLDHGYIAQFLNAFLRQNTQDLVLDTTNLKQLVRVDAPTVEQLIRARRTLQPVFAYELHAAMLHYMQLVEAQPGQRRG